MSPKLPVTLSVLLPTSIVSEASDLQQKTIRVGLIGRALAIFRVDNVILYDDNDPHTKDQAAESNLVATLLRYVETPQYLRKLLFSRQKDLRFAGLLPPLRTPHHPLGDEKMKLGDYREAVVIQSDKRGSILEIGLREKGVTSEMLKVGRRLTIRLGECLDKDRVAVQPFAREGIGEYWGFEVALAKSLADALKDLNADYVIGTSRYGKNLYEAVRGIESSNPMRVAVAFGGPYAGLLEMCGRLGVDAKDLFDVVINTIPHQGTATVRTEEALMVTLGLLNSLAWGK
jgi:predicted SPOUT superfamily RNA methylase MTH1